MELQRSKNKVVIFSEREYDLHLIVKTLCMKKLLEHGRKKVQSEVPVNNPFLKSIKIMDVVDYDDGVFYEVERKPTKEYVEMIKKIEDDLMLKGIVLNLGEIPEHIVKAMEELSSWVDGRTR